MFGIVTIHGIIEHVGFCALDLRFGVGHGCGCGAEKSKALVSSRVGLSWVVARDDIVVKVDRIILEDGFKIGEKWIFGLGTCYKAVYLVT